MQMTDDMLEAVIVGKVRIVDSLTNKKESWKLSPEQLTRFRAATQRGFVVLRQGRVDERLSHVFYSWCESNNRPWVWVRPRRRYALVHSDMITVLNPSRGLPESALDEVERKLDEVCPRGGYGLGTMVITVSRVELDQADDLATWIVDHIRTQIDKKGA